MKKIICNPLNLEYRYQIKKTGSLAFLGIAAPKEETPPKFKLFREAADPTVLLFKGVYYLFASMSGGFWYSDDLYSWKFKETPELPIYDYAPDVREIGGAVVFSASKINEPCTFYKSGDPLNKPFEAVSAPFPFHDPNIFQDDDGRVYFYWGCSSSEPIYGLEVDPATFTPLGEKIALISENETEHGWERNGENNVLGEPKDEAEKMKRQYIGTKPFIEGAFMTKRGGLYYLQYSAPGTEYNVYADGVYVGKSPLGPFEYQRHNPFSSKPGGFITAAGHGSTFADKYGNWWHASTMRISVHESFERRIGLFPCFFDEDGVMYCNQNFVDYPFELPEGLRQAPDIAEPPCMLLSFKKESAASSCQHGFEPCRGTDEDVRTWWAAMEKDEAAWYRLDLGGVYEVNAVQINFADHNGKAPDISADQMRDEGMGMSYRYIETKPQKTEYLLEYSADGKTWITLADRRNAGSDLCHDFITPGEPVKARYLRVSEIKLPFGGVPSISGLRVFGKGGGNKPAKVDKLEAARDGALDIDLKWQPAENAAGYNIRYGIAPDKLYSSWQVYGVTSLRLSAVNKGETYYIAVDSFNENGVTLGAVNAVN
jgi:hypothetical protein